MGSGGHFEILTFQLSHYFINAIIGLKIEMSEVQAKKWPNLLSFYPFESPQKTASKVTFQLAPFPPPVQFSLLTTSRWCRLIFKGYVTSRRTSQWHRLIFKGYVTSRRTSQWCRLIFKRFVTSRLFLLSLLQPATLLTTSRRAVYSCRLILHYQGTFQPFLTCPPPKTIVNITFP